MAKPKKDKNPTYTYIKEFTTFEEGYKDLVSLIPSIENYGGEEPTLEAVVASLSKVIIENIPSPDNENFPNTFSFSISAKELGFLTDDSIAFGYRIFMVKEDDSHVFQFRVTFTALSVSKRKYIEKLLNNGWKERDLSDKQSRFWNEISSGQRPAYKEGSENPPQVQQNKNVPKVHEKPKTVVPEAIDSSTIVPAPEVETTTNEETTYQQVEIVEEEVVEEPKIISNPNPPPTIVEQPQNQIVKIQESQEELQKQQIAEINKQKAYQQCQIIPGGTPAVFVISHFGQNMVININDRNDGVFVDRSSYNIKIDNVLYNYKNFTVQFLETDFKPEQAQFAAAIDGKMLHHKPLPDEAFVGGHMVNERAAEVPTHTIVPPPKQQLSQSQQQYLEQKMKQNFNLIPPEGTVPKQNYTQGRVMQAAKALVIDRTPKPNLHDSTNGVVNQVVKVTDNLYGQA